MQIALLQFVGEIRWKLSTTDPRSYKMYAFPGVELLHPLIFLDLIRSTLVGDLRSAVMGSLEGTWLTRTTGIALVIAEEDIEKYRLRDDSLLLLDVAATLLDALRYFSKQAEMRTGADHFASCLWLTVDDLPRPSPTVRNESSVAKWLVDTAITRSQIESACACSAGFRPPVFDTLLLDATSAHAAHDYRRSILYSAMSLETAVAMLLDERYETEVRQSNSAAWRTIALPQAGGRTVRKDPIWEMLRGREDSNSLLHEGALYILKRSLLVECQALFGLAQRLRATRNKIVHQGEPPELATDQYLSIDRDGSAKALGCTKAILNWLGITERYTLREPGFVRLDRSDSTTESG
jgi:hypothetical protein